MKRRAFTGPAAMPCRPLLLGCSPPTTWQGVANRKASRGKGALLYEPAKSAEPAIHASKHSLTLNHRPAQVDSPVALRPKVHV